MRNFTDSLFEDLTEYNIKQLTDVPGATRLLNDVIQRISYVFMCKHYPYSFYRKDCNRCNGCTCLDLPVS